MVDRFVDRVAELSGRTTRTLKLVAEQLYEAGLDPQGRLVARIAEEHAKVALDCLVETQPIDVGRLNYAKRVKVIIRDLENLAADLELANKDFQSVLASIVRLKKTLKQFDERD